MAHANAEDYPILDLRDLDCPEPVLKTKSLLDNPTIIGVEALVAGEVNVQNLQRLAHSLSLTCSWGPEKDFFRVLISRPIASRPEIERENQAMADLPEKKQDKLTEPSVIQASQTLLPRQPSDQAKAVIFLTKDTFGQGDPQFSASLLNIFLQTIYQAGHRPQAILLANTGVRLMAKTSAFLTVLNDFKSSGVPVLACGLCVDFYGLKDDLAKEDITNMYAICEYLFAAQKIISC